MQILIDEDRYERLAEESRRRKVSVAEVIRESIDIAIPPRWSDRATAGAAILAAEPMDLPASVAELKAELDELRGRRG
jgi:hypothetical protein